MQYGHLPTLGERRDSNLDSNGSTPFQTHQSLGQALGGVGTHLQPPYRNDYRGISTSPPSLNQQTNHSPLNFTNVPPTTSPAIKRKLIDPSLPQQKRRREIEETDGYDNDPGGQGAKHWTDDEKSKLFTWLMGPGQDEHWTALRATKNSCLRQCAGDVFGSKKTYQALKGCYERNFTLFKQIYAFEQYTASSGSNHANFSEADRLREYERRLGAARKAGCDVGNISPRTIEHWHRRGWYELFYRRWHGDPATTRPSQPRNVANGGNNQGAIDDGDADDDHLSQPPSTAPTHQPQQQTQPPPPQQQTTLEFADPSTLTNGMNGFTPINYINPQSLRDNIVPPSPATVPPGPSVQHPNTSVNGVGANSHPHSNMHTHSVPHPAPSTSSAPPVNISSSHTILPSSSSSSSSTAVNPTDSPLVTITIPQNMLSSWVQFLQLQSQTTKMKLEYMRRKEEREERESTQRTQLERKKYEREAAEFEHNKNSANTKQKADRAIELLSHPNIDQSVKNSASEFLKKLFASD